MLICHTGSVDNAWQFINGMLLLHVQSSDYVNCGWYILVKRPICQQNIIRKWHHHKPMDPPLKEIERFIKDEVANVMILFGKETNEL